jgi:hypothetical protein
MGYLNIDVHRFRRVDILVFVKKSKLYSDTRGFALSDAMNI